MAKKKKPEVNEVKEIIDVIPVACGFAPEHPDSDDGINEGSAMVIISTSGEYDIICSYYNKPCRHNCQILKTIINSKANPSIPEYEDNDVEVDFTEDFDNDLDDEIDDEEDD